MINGTYFFITLDYRNINPMIYFLIKGCILDIKVNTFLALSTNLIGNSPPVRLRTYLSVTSDLRLRTIGFFTCGTCGKYFQIYSLILLQIIISTFYYKYSDHHQVRQIIYSSKLMQQSIKS
jgi:hypothetical protein